MARTKIESIVRTGAGIGRFHRFQLPDAVAGRAVIGPDSPIRTMHLAEVLASR